MNRVEHHDFPERNGHGVALIHGAIAQMHLGMKGPVFLFNQPESIKHIESDIPLIAFEGNPV